MRSIPIYATLVLLLSMLSGTYSRPASKTPDFPAAHCARYHLSGYYGCLQAYCANYHLPHSRCGMIMANFYKHIYAPDPFNPRPQPTPESSQGYYDMDCSDGRCENMSNPSKEANGRESSSACTQCTVPSDCSSEICVNSKCLSAYTKLEGDRCGIKGMSGISELCSFCRFGNECESGHCFNTKCVRPAGEVTKCGETD